MNAPPSLSSLAMRPARRSHASPVQSRMSASVLAVKFAFTHLVRLSWFFLASKKPGAWRLM
jgi:hypothetical protein